MSGASAGSPADGAPLGPSLLTRLRGTVGPGVRVDIAQGGFYVAKSGAPGYHTIARRPVKLVQGWRKPESTFAFVVRWEQRMASKKKESR